MTQPEYILTDVFSGIVTKAAGNLTAMLASISASAGLHFYYGYLTELNDTLAQKDKTSTGSVTKYPFIWLEQPFTVINSSDNYYSTATMKLFIVMESSASYKAAQRMELVYKPVLYPVYTELMNQINKSSAFIIPGGITRIQHSKTDYYFFSDASGKRSVFNDVVDCICISGLKLNVNPKVCN